MNVEAHESAAVAQKPTASIVLTSHVYTIACHDSLPHHMPTAPVWMQASKRTLHNMLCMHKEQDKSNVALHAQSAVGNMLNMITSFEPRATVTVTLSAP